MTPLTREQRIRTIVETLRPADPGSWEPNILYVTAEFDSYDAALRTDLELMEQAMRAMDDPIQRLRNTSKSFYRKRIILTNKVLAIWDQGKAHWRNHEHLTDRS